MLNFTFLNFTSPLTPEGTFSIPLHFFTLLFNMYLYIHTLTYTKRAILRSIPGGALQIF